MDSLFSPHSPSEPAPRAHMCASARPPLSAHAYGRVSVRESGGDIRPRGSEVDGDSLALPVAETRGFGTSGAAVFGRFFGLRFQYTDSLVFRFLKKKLGVFKIGSVVDIDC